LEIINWKLEIEKIVEWKIESINWKFGICEFDS